MIGSDPPQLLLGSGRFNALEELGDLEGPHSQIFAEDGGLLVVGHFDQMNRLYGLSQSQLHVSASPNVAHPLRLSARRDQITAPGMFEHIDGSRAPFAAGSAPDGEDARAVD